MASGASKFIKSTAILVLCTPNHTVPVKVSPALRKSTCRPLPSRAAFRALFTTLATLANPPTHLPFPGWLHVPEFLLVSSKRACISFVCRIKRSKFSPRTWSIINKRMKHKNARIFGNEARWCVLVRRAVLTDDGADATTLKECAG